MSTGVEKKKTARRNKKPKELATVKLPGRPSKFRGKDRTRPIQIYMTPLGLKALEEGCTRKGETRPEYIEGLILNDNPGVSI